MSDVGTIKLNVAKMIDGGANEREIDTYLSSEGVTAQQLRDAGPRLLVTSPSRSALAR